MRVVSIPTGLLVHRVPVCDACGWSGTGTLLISDTLAEVDSHVCSLVA